MRHHTPRPVAGFTACLALLIATPAALSAADLLPPDLDAAIDRAYRGAERVVPTVAYPRSRETREALIGGLPAGDDGLAGALGFEGGELRLALSLDVQPESYLEANRADLGFLEELEREEPLLRFRTSYGLDGGPRLVTQTVLQREYDVELPTNIPLPAEGNPAPFENNFFYTGYLYVPGEYLETTFGRQQLHIGPSPFSSLMVSDRIPYLDAARLSLSLGRLRMTHVVSTIENRASEAELAAGLPAVLADPQWEHGDQYAYGRNIIFYNVHYFEYAWDRLRLGIGGQMMVSRPMNQFQLGDFFPVFSWHNADIVPNNMCLILDASYAAAPGVEIYAQAGFDDISAETFGIADSELPTIPGLLAGLTYRPATDGPALSVLLEGGYTHYLWGNFHEEFLLSRAVYRQDTDAGSRSMPLTSPYGPGVVWGTLRGSVSWQSGLSLGASYLLRAENTEADLYETPYRASEAVAGAPRRLVHRIALRPAFRTGESFGLFAEPALIVDDGEPGFEATLGLAWRYARVWRP